MHFKISLVILFLAGSALPVVARHSESHGLTTTSITREADKPLTFEKVKLKARHAHHKKAAGTPTVHHSVGPAGKWPIFTSDLWGMNQSQLERKFPTPQFSHNADYSQIRWHGTDVSSVLDIQFVNQKVTKIRYSTNYGYPRPGTKSSVEISPWLRAPLPSVRDDQSLHAFKRQLKQH